MKKKYYFILGNGQKFFLKFEEGNFYHLLGFHKFTKTIFVQMIEQDAYSYNATNFYNDVMNENIKFDWWDEEKVIVPPNLLDAGYCRNFIDQKEESDVKNVINRRFPYFTYDNLIGMLSNKVIIDYDEEQSESDVRADKIFFTFLSETNRNLNFGVDVGKKGYFPTTFFLENKKDWFKYKKDGKPSDILDILGIYIADTDCGKTILFKTNWGAVRTKILNEYNIISYTDMKKLFNKENVTSFYMRNQIAELKKRILEQTGEIEELKYKIGIMELEIRYLDNDSDEDAILGLMDFGIDVESEELSRGEILKENKKLLKDMHIKNELNKKLEKKIKKIQNAMSDIQKLDRLMVQSIYNNFVDNSVFWIKSFWDYFIEEFNWIESDIEPVKLKKIYADWKNK